MEPDMDSVGGRLRRGYAREKAVPTGRPHLSAQEREGADARRALLAVKLGRGGRKRLAQEKEKRPCGKKSGPTLLLGCRREKLGGTGPRE